MEVYIRTRGDALSQGYRWVQLGADGSNAHALREPLIAQKPEANNLIYAEEFSLLLARFGPRLTLQITGLPISERSNRQRRNVQNILACVGSWPTDEGLLRGIAVAALDGSLADLVDARVSAVPESPGFRVDEAGLRADLTALRLPPGNIPTSGALTDQDGDLTRQRLIRELRTSALPDRNGYLVVVTRYRAPDLLVRTRVWRGLTSQVDGAVAGAVGSGPFFPFIEVQNRLGEQLLLPDQFDANLVLVMLGKHLHHRHLGKKWMEALDPIHAKHHIPLYILLFTGSSIETLIKSLLTHVALSRRVVTIEQNQEYLLESLHLDNGDTLTLLLVDRAGRIFWQGAGECDEQQIAALTRKLVTLGV